MVNEKNNKEIQKPDVVAFEVTRKCRFNCRHCRAAAHYDSKRKEMSTYPCKMILQSIADYNKGVVILTGGEPMERPDIVKLVEHGTELGLTMAMATCGYLLDEENILKLKHGGLKAFSFSIDFSDPGKYDRFRDSTGAFDVTMKAIDLAKHNNIRFQINTTISKYNIDELDKIADLAEGLGAVCFNPFILVPTGRADVLKDQVLEPEQYQQVLNKLFDIKKKLRIDLRVTCGPQFSKVCHDRKLDDNENAANGCLAATGFAFINYKGDVQTCGFLDISAGNLLENGFNFKNIWENSIFLKKMRELAGYKGKCSFCEYLERCRGCRARAYSITGDYLAPDPICNYIPKKEES